MHARLATLLLALVFALAGCGGGGADDTADDGTTAATEASPTTTDDDADDDDDGGDDGGDDAGEGDVRAGSVVFATAGCGSCHTMAAANATASVGPNLDESDPDYELVVERVTNGMGQMPSFGDQLTEKQIQDVAAYVSESAGD